MRLALVQTMLEPGQSLRDFEELTMNCLKLAMDADLVLFPELGLMSLVPLEMSEEEIGRHLNRLAAEKAFRGLLSKLSREAKRTGKVIVAGSLPHAQRGKIFNRVHLFRAGEKTLVYDKQCMTPDEQIYGWHTGRRLLRFDWQGVRCALVICYDVEFPAISMQLAKAPVDLLLVPSLTTVKGFHRVHLTAAARAIEHHCFVAVTGMGDLGDAPEYWSQPRIYAPSSEEFAFDYRQGNLNRQEVFITDLEVAKIQASKKSTGFYPVRDWQRRP